MDWHLNQEERQNYPCPHATKLCELVSHSFVSSLMGILFQHLWSVPYFQRPKWVDQENRIFSWFDIILTSFSNSSTDHDEFSNSVKYDCFSNSIAISLTKNRLSNFNHALFHLNNESCTGQQINTTHIRLQTELNDCGTLKQILGNGSVIYTNRVYGYIKGQKNKPGSASKTYKVKCVKPHDASERNVSTFKYDSVVPNFSTQDSTLFQVGHHHKAFSLQQRNGKFCPRPLH